MVDENKVKRGRVSRAQGNAFEAKVRTDLEESGWIIDKWTNNVDLDDNKLVKAKNKWSGPGRPMMMGAGFPDFIAFRPMPCSTCYARMGDISTENHKIIGVESKLTGELDREEKKKCKWLLDNKIFSQILIAEKTKVKNRVVIVYNDFKKKYWRFYDSKD